MNNETNDPTESDTKEVDAFNELCGYTLTHFDPAFIHQYVVDAYAAQKATETTKPIKLTFALVGLYLHVEQGYTGKHVQQIHMQLSQHRQGWPTFAQPAGRGTVTAVDVMAVPAGAGRDAAIDAWCESVWSAYRATAPMIVALLGAKIGFSAP